MDSLTLANGAKAPTYLTKDSAAIQQFLDKFDTFLFDCDGVLWSGDVCFPGVPETLAMLREMGKRTVFVTNNSTKSRHRAMEKMASFGIKVDLDNMFTSPYSSVLYIQNVLKLHASPKPKVFIIGEVGIETELRDAGIPCIGGTDPALRREMTREEFQGIADGSLLDEDVGAVLIGVDYNLNYLKLSLACHYILKGAVFLATNTDALLPSDHTVFPAAGCVSAPITACTGVQPISLGKPHSAMLDTVQSKFGLDLERTCMVGDRLDSDICFGINGGLGGTLLVLTGVHQRDDIEKPTAPAIPMFLADTLADIRGIDA